MAVQKTAEKPYVAPSIGQHLQLLKTGNGLRELVLMADDLKLAWHALDKLVEKEDWLNLWEVVFRTDEHAARRSAAKKRLFSSHVDEKNVERVGDAIKHRVLFSKHKQKIDKEAADILSDWMATNNMWRQLMSMSLFGDENLQNAANERFSNLTIKEADTIVKLDGHLAFDIWHTGVNDPVVKKHLEGKLEKSGESFSHG